MACGALEIRQFRVLFFFHSRLVFFGPPIIATATNRKCNSGHSQWIYWSKYALCITNKTRQNLDVYIRWNGRTMCSVYTVVPIFCGTLVFLLLLFCSVSLIVIMLGASVVHVDAFIGIQLLNSTQSTHILPLDCFISLFRLCFVLYIYCKFILVPFFLVSFLLHSLFPKRSPIMRFSKYVYLSPHSLHSDILLRCVCIYE